MAVKLPRTRKNYPTHRIAIAGRIKPEAMDFIENFHWTLKVSKSAMVYYAFNYALNNKEKFIEFCKQSKQLEDKKRCCDIE